MDRFESCFLRITPGSDCNWHCRIWNIPNWRLNFLYTVAALYIYRLNFVLCILSNKRMVVALCHSHTRIFRVYILTKMFTSTHLLNLIHLNISTLSYITTIEMIFVLCWIEVLSFVCVLCSTIKTLYMNVAYKTASWLTNSS